MLSYSNQQVITDEQWFSQSLSVSDTKHYIAINPFSGPHITKVSLHTGFIGMWQQEAGLN